MRKKILLILLSTCLLFALRAAAETVRFPDVNFSIDTPRGWAPVDPLPDKATLAVESPDGAKRLLLLVAKAPHAQLATFARDFDANAKKSMEGRGWKIIAEQQATVDNVMFADFTARNPDGAKMIEYTGVAGENLYVIETIQMNGDAPDDPELLAAVHSFRLLAPAVSHFAPSEHSSTAYRIGNIFVVVLIIALLTAAFGWAVRHGLS